MSNLTNFGRQIDNLLYIPSGDPPPSSSRQFILGRRGSGKTLAAIKLAAQTNGVIVCLSHTNIPAILGLAYEHGYKIPKPTTYEDLQRRALGETNQHWILDDTLEYLLSRVCYGNFRPGNKISAITIDLGPGGNLSQKRRPPSYLLNLDPDIEDPLPGESVLLPKEGD